MFPEGVVALHKTRDITKFIIQSTCNLALAKINYEKMEFSILYRLETGKKEQIVSVCLLEADQDELVLVLVQNKWGKHMRVFRMEQNKLRELESHFGN